MKLFLTSAGITNKSIAGAVKKALGKPVSKAKVGFIPTAANMEPGNKDWYIAQLNNLQKFGFNHIDIIEIADRAVDYRKRLKDMDMIFVSGGNTFHLLNEYRETGFGEWLQKALKNKVYVGVSAGSIVMTPTIAVASIPPRDNNFLKLKDLAGMGFVDFEVEPHCAGKRFKTIEKYAKKSDNPIYAIDDDGAVALLDGKIEVISEGKWELYE